MESLILRDLLVANWTTINAWEEFKISLQCIFVSQGEWLLIRIFTILLTKKRYRKITEKTHSPYNITISNKKTDTFFGVSVPKSVKHMMYQGCVVHDLVKWGDSLCPVSTKKQLYTVTVRV